MTVALLVLSGAAEQAALWPTRDGDEFLLAGPYGRALRESAAPRRR